MDLDFSTASDSELSQLFDDSIVPTWSHEISSPQLVELEERLKHTVNFWVQNIENPNVEMLLPTVMMIFFYMDFILRDEF